MKKYIWLWIVLVLIAVLVPIVINESYKLNKGYETLWSASEMLVYMATIISAFGTVYVSCIAISQNKKANDISDRLLKLEEIRSVPSLSIIEEKTQIFEYNENSVHLKVFLKNISNGIIDIKSVSNLKFEIISSDVAETLRFVKKSLDFPTLLPGQEKQLDFYINKHSEEIRLCEPKFIRRSGYELFWNALFEIELEYKDSSTTYKETVKLNGNAEISIFDNVKIEKQQITRSDYKLEKFQTRFDVKIQ